MATVAKRKWIAPNGEPKEAWALRYVDRLGRHRQETFKLKKAADARRVQIEGELADGVHIAKGAGILVADLAKRFMEEVADDARRGIIRPGTLANYRDAIDRTIVPAFAKRKAHEIETDEIEDWLRELYRSSGLAPATAKRRFHYLKLMFDFGVRRKYMKVNPAMAVRRELRTVRTETIRTFELDEIKAVLRTVAIRPPRFEDMGILMLRCAVMLAAFNGLRRGEIFGLTAAAIDIDRGTLAINHSLDRFGNLQPPKTKAGYREVRLATPLVALLSEWLERYPPAGPDGLVFRTRGGRPIECSNFHRDQWRPLLLRAGVIGKGDETIHFHALRHFAASWMIESGWPIPDVALALGHANVGITMKTYAHAIGRRAQSLEAIDALTGPLLSRGSAPSAPAVAPKMLAHGQRMAA